MEPLLYLICFDQPYRHARHYLGWVESADRLDRRMDRHRRGVGAKLLAVLKVNGIGWRVVRTWPDGTKSDERRMKRRGHSPDYCPVCRVRRRKPTTVVGEPTG